MNSPPNQKTSTQQRDTHLRADELPDPVLALKHRLIERIADADQTHMTLSTGPNHWESFTPGVRIRRLYECNGVLSYLLNLEPGATLPAHRHPLDEECVVLQGQIRVGKSLEIKAGGYHLAHMGALHASITTRDGAIVFLRGAIPEAHHVLG